MKNSNVKFINGAWHICFKDGDGFEVMRASEVKSRGLIDENGAHIPPEKLEISNDK